MLDKRIYEPLCVIIVFILTILVPIFLGYTKHSIDFTIKYLLGLSLPIWVVILTLSLFYYKKVIKENVYYKHHENISLPNAEEAKIHYERMHKGVSKLNNAEASVKNIEVALTICGLFAVILGVIEYLY